MKNSGPAGRLEAALCAVVVVILCAHAALLSLRAEPGLLRYETDQALRVEQSMAEAQGTACDPIGSQPGTVEQLQALEARCMARLALIERTVADLLKLDAADAQALTEGYAATDDPGLFAPAIERQRAAAVRELQQRASAHLESARAVQQAYDLEVVRAAIEPMQRRFREALARNDTALAASELARMLDVLDGRSRGPAGRTVRRWLDSSTLADRAQAAQQVVVNAPWLLLTWGAWSWLMVVLGRSGRLGPLFPAAAIAAGAATHLLLASALDMPMPGTLASWGLATLALAGAGLGCHRLGWLQGATPARPASAWLLPGWLLFAGAGFLVIADLSVGFSQRLRFQVVDQYHDLTLAMIALACLAPLARPLAIAALSAYRWAAAPPRQEPGRRWWSVVAACLFAGAVLAAAVLGVSGGKYYVTGELIKATILAGAAAFLALRGVVLVEVARAKPAPGWLRRLSPLLVILATGAAALLVARDLGPLLVLAFSAAILVGGLTRVRWGLLGVGLIAAGIFAAQVAQWVPGAAAVGQTVAGRVAMWWDPFSAPRDDVARLLWFQQEVPLLGFGPGRSPWCGYTSGSQCTGLPEQIQSDYTVTAVVGIWGVGGWLVILLLGAWAVMLARAWAATPVKPEDLLRTPWGAVTAFRAWLALAFGVLVAIQSAVTVAGNVSWMPLTGITLPFVSLGSTSLLVFTAILAVLLNQEAPGEKRR